MAETLSGFHLFFIFDPQGCRFRSNPGLKLANAFGVKIQTEPVPLREQLRLINYHVQ
jgi:hypothetical protein